MNIKKFFAQPQVKAAFDDYNIQERIRLVKIICWVAAIAMPSGAFLDLIDYPNYFHHFLEIRLASSFTSLILLGLVYTPWGNRQHLLISLLSAVQAQAYICCMIYASDGGISPYYAILNLPLLIYCLLFPWTYLMTFGLSMATVVFYLIACFLHGGMTAHYIFYSNLILLMYTVSFAVLGTYYTNQLRMREFMTRYELDENKKMLEESNRKLVELDKTKTSFFANISHELRTPLTLLIAPLETFQREKGHLFDGETRSTLKIMEDNALRLLKLINDLLDLVKLESGRMETRKEPLKIPEFLKGITLSVQGAARDKKINLSCSVGENLGSVLADRDKLEKILLNLLFNSVKFTPSGGKIELSAQEEGTSLILKVTDTGMGISEKDLPHIFNRFWQADSSAQRKYQGTGIGLSLVKELVEIQGGMVTAESRLGEGTTMIVRLPLEKTDTVAVEPAVEKGAAALVEPAAHDPQWLEKLYRRAELFPAMTAVTDTLRPDVFGSGAKPRVLVADDEPDMLRFLKTQLEKHYEVLEAVDGRQAVEKARQFLPDLVLLDMMMPEMDGIEACRILKEAVSTRAIPTLLLTARADDPTKMAALGAGASDFLTKPFSTTELHVRVKNLIVSYQFQRDLARQKTALESALEQLKETEGLLIQNEKMASLGRLSAGIIHEINNPLNYASQALYLLKTKKDRLPEGDREKYVEIVSDIEEGVGRVQRIVSDLRTFSHPHTGDARDLIDLEEAVSASLRFLGHEVKDKVRVEVDIPKEKKVLADRNKLIHVFVNLLQNSVDAMKEKKFEGEKPFISINSREEKSKVMVSVRDNGTGIDLENLGKIFDPFFTTKDVGQGMGLGLSICYRIMAEQGGGISVKSEKGKFAEFILELPVREPATTSKDEF